MFAQYWFFPNTKHSEKVSLTSHFKILLDLLLGNGRGIPYGEVRDYYYYYKEGELNGANIYREWQTID